MFGCTITTNSIDVAARAATAGFHFLWLEMEHSPMSLETLRNIVLATRDLPAVPFARVPVNENWTAKRVLDAGVHGVIFPFTSTPALAQQAAAACRYPPVGRRGSGASLASASWPDPDRYPDSADHNVMVIAIIEEELRSRTRTRSRRRRESTSCSSGPATCRSRSGCAATSAILASRSRRR